jgi:hypothetical protein
MGIVSLMLGILCAMTLFDDSAREGETLLGPGLFASSSLILGVVGINQNKPGNGLASAGVVTASIWLLRLVGLKSAS